MRPDQATPVIERIVRRLDLDSKPGCWLWTGALSSNGYGLVQLGSRTDGTYRQARVHRVTYEHFVGPIGEGLQIDHLCRRTACCNPEHLEAVVPVENLRRGNGYGGHKTHCPQGHPYSGANLYVYPDGRRKCRTCERLAARKRRKPAAM